MSKLLTTLLAAVFAAVTITPVAFAQDKKDEKKGEMKKEGEFLRSKGTVARYSVEKGQPHGIETLAGANAGRLFDGFEETEKGCSK